MASKVRSSLAELFDARGDTEQAISHERRALAICEHLPDPADRAVSHNNLSNYLGRAGGETHPREAARHRLATLLYCLSAGLNESLKTSLGNYVIDFRRAQEAGSELVVPAVSELLADPAFAPLAEWLAQRQGDPAELQQQVNERLRECRQRALAAYGSPPPPPP
jgi:hypothetical protein